MRIVIDLQGAQSSGSRNRGIGRYTMSLAQAIVRNKGEHEVIVALNGLFPDTIEPIRAVFDCLLPQEAICIWQAPESVNHVNTDNNWRRRSAELVREAFLASLKPDIVLVSSLFEGLDEDVVTSIGLLSLTVPTAVILYDLIPLIQRNPYLENPVIELFYENKLDHLRRANLLLAISESSRQEGIHYLGFPVEKIINVSTAADSQFQPQLVNTQREKEIRQRYGLDRPFVMYTGGIDHRKNIEGLIRAYAKLSKPLRVDHQLVIVCSIQPSSRASLKKLAKKQGLSADELVLTGFVPDDDLLALYNLCKLFVFPSWHEGFGLPALEAMCCGRAVIGANTSSLPEVIGRVDALFDPYNDESITSKMTQVLSDDVFRQQLEQHGLNQAKHFSWDVSAKAAITTFEAWHISQTVPPVIFASSSRPKLAYISPLPPKRSGISDYSAELLPQLARHYDIDVIVMQNSISNPSITANYQQQGVEWLKAHADDYDRILYHFGNNHLHQHMFDLIEEVPGIVVMHDFFLSGIVRHMDLTGYAPGKWDRALYSDHGYAPLRMRYHEDDLKVIERYPNNLNVLNKTKGVIVHSENSLELAKRWYGSHACDDWAVIPLLRSPAIAISKSAARIALDIDKDDFVVCSFGFLSPTKLNSRLLDAWLSSPLARNKNCLLIFVGENNGETYGADLLKTIKKHGADERICITGWVDTDTFHQYLAAADIGVQLRTLSRGETSAAVLDCMNYGLPTIINAHGSLMDLPKEAVWMLPDEFANSQLVDALEILWSDKSRRQQLSEKARETILTHHAPRACADQYAKAIESMYRMATTDISNLSRVLSWVQPAPIDADSWSNLANAIAQSIPPRIATKQLLIDVSELIQRQNTKGACSVDHTVLRELLMNPPAGYRVEPIYITPERECYYARQFTLRFLECPEHILEDEVIEFRGGDVFLGLYSERDTVHQQEHLYQTLRLQGVKVIFFIDRTWFLGKNTSQNWPPTWLSIACQCDGVICLSREEAIEIEALLPAVCANRPRPFHIGSIQTDNDPSTMAAYELHQDVKKSSSSWSLYTKKIVDIVLFDKWMARWMPDGGYRYFGSDKRLGSQVGRKDGFLVQTTMSPGFLFFGPFLSLPTGHYKARIYGQVKHLGSPPAYADVAAEGNLVLSPHTLSALNEKGVIAEMAFFLKTSVPDLEVRVWVAADSDLNISKLEILPEALFETYPNRAETPTLLDFPNSLPRPKIGWLTTWNTKCGIASYSEHLIGGMSDEVTIFAAHQDEILGSDVQNCYRSWQTNKNKNDLQHVANLIQTKCLNTIIIQFNYGFFNFSELTQFIENQLDDGHIVIFMMHSTVDPYGDTPNWRLLELRDVLSRCHRILVHSNSDLDRLKALGLVNNVCIFPHGVLSYESIRYNKSVPKSSDLPLIAAYGFCLPHKGLKELIEAADLLKQQGTPIQLRLVNAEYPNPVSTNLIQELKGLVAALSLNDFVEFHNEYLEDEESLALLSNADLLVFPYQVTGESSSAAVRYGLATKRPVAVTPLSIFEDLGESVFHFSGIKPSDIAQGINEFLEDIHSNSERAQLIHAEANRWREAHDYRAVSARLQNMCIALLSNNEAYSKVIPASGPSEPAEITGV